MTDHMDKTARDCADHAARLARENARLREVLEEIAGVGFSEPMTWAQSTEAWERRRANIMQKIARAALTDAQEGRDDG